MIQSMNKFAQKLWIYSVIILFSGLAAFLLGLALGGDILDGLAGAPTTNTPLLDFLLSGGMLVVAGGAVLLVVAIPLKIFIKPSRTHTINSKRL